MRPKGENCANFNAPKKKMRPATSQKRPLCAIAQCFGHTEYNRVIKLSFFVLFLRLFFEKKSAFTSGKVGVTLRGKLVNINIK